MLKCSSCIRLSSLMHGAAIGEEEHCERRQDADGARPSQGSQRAVAQVEGAESSTCTLTEVDRGGVQREGDVPCAGASWTTWYCWSGFNAKAAPPTTRAPPGYRGQRVPAPRTRRAPRSRAGRGRA